MGKFAGSSGPGKTGAEPAVDADVQEGILKRIDDAIAARWSQMEASIEKLGQQIAAQNETLEQQQDMVHEVLLQMTTLIGTATAEQRKGKRRDRQLDQFKELIDKHISGAMAPLSPRSGRSQAEDDSELAMKVAQMQQIVEEIAQQSTRAKATVDSLAIRLTCITDELEVVESRREAQHITLRLFALKAFRISEQKRETIIPTLEKQAEGLREMFRALADKRGTDVSAGEVPRPSVPAWVSSSDPLSIPEVEDSIHEIATNSNTSLRAKVTRGYRALAQWSG